MKKVVLGVIIVLVLAYFTFKAFSTGFHDIWGAFGKVSFIPLILFIVISVLNIVVYTIRWDVILHAGKSRAVPFPHMVLARFAAYAIGYIVPSAQLGGEPLKILFLQRHGVGRKEAVASIIIDKIFEAAIMVVFGLVAFTILVMSSQGTVSEQSGYAILGLGVLLMVLYFFLTIYSDGFFTVLIRLCKLYQVAFIKKYIEKIAEVEQLMKHFFLHHRKELIGAILLTLSTYIIFILEYVVIFMSLGIHVTVPQLIVVSTLPMIAYLVPIPGAVGAFEASQIAALNLAGVDPVLAFPIIIFIRLRDFIFIAIGILGASREGLSFFGKKSHNAHGKNHS